LPRRVLGRLRGVETELHKHVILYNSGWSSSFKSMVFDASQYGAEVAGILALGENGTRLTSLHWRPCVSEEARKALSACTARELFPKHKEPGAPMAGLWLYFSCFEEAHQLIEAPHTRDGVYWHAILHRMEPDDGNAAYWFRRLGQHPIFHELALEARKLIAAQPEVEFRVGDWDPYSFIAHCDRARKQPGTVQEKVALEIQRAEWQLLFDHCARGGK
jgi:hypothetical protein